MNSSRWPAGPSSSITPQVKNMHKLNRDIRDWLDHVDELGDATGPPAIPTLFLRILHNLSR